MAVQNIFEREGAANTENSAYIPMASAFGDDKMVVVGSTPSGYMAEVFRANVNGSVDARSVHLPAAAPAPTVEYYNPQALIVGTRLYLAFRSSHLSGGWRATIFTYRIGDDLGLVLENTRTHYEPGQPVNRVVADPVGQQFLISTYDSVRTGSQVIRAQANGPVDRLIYANPDVPMPPSGGQHRYYTALAYWQNDVLMYNGENNADIALSNRFRIGRTGFNSVAGVTFATGGVHPKEPDYGSPTYNIWDPDQVPPFLFTGPTTGAMRRGTDGVWHQIRLDLGQFPSSPKTVTLDGPTFSPAADQAPVLPQVQAGVDTVYGVGKEVNEPGSQSVLRRDIFDPSKNLYGPSDNYRPRWAYRTSQGRWLVYSRFSLYTKVAQWGDPVPQALSKQPYRGRRYFLFTATGGAETALRLRGPSGDRLYADQHMGTFRIHSNRMISMQFRVGTVTPIVVDVFAEWMRIQRDAFVPEAIDPLVKDLVVEYAEDPAEWTLVNAHTTQVPAGVSHWRPKIVLNQMVITGPLRDPATGELTGNWTKQPLMPGQQVAFDGFYVEETGRPLSGQDYLDGDQSGGRWEGEFHNSSSVRGLPDPVSGPNIVFPETIIVPEDEGGGTPEPDDLVSEVVSIQV